MPDVTLRPVTKEDYSSWLNLYQGYAAHYQVALTENGLATTWDWLMDPRHPLEGMVADTGEELIGLAHYRPMPSPLRGAEIGFLDDLFVAPSRRGGRIGAMMLEELRRIARHKGWPLVRWITRDNNYRARTLYDRHAVKSDWNTYEMGADQP